MLAEIAAANAAFEIIKAALSNGKELADVGGKVIDYFDATFSLQESGNAKVGGRPAEGRSDIEEFMALEKLRQQEEYLKESMVYAGRPGMWDDWLKFKAMAARKRRESREEEKRKIAQRRKKIAEIVEIVAIAFGMIVLASLMLYGLYFYFHYLRK